MINPDDSLDFAHSLSRTTTAASTNCVVYIERGSVNRETHYLLSFMLLTPGASVIGK